MREREEFNPDFEDDECCMNCGDYQYNPSNVPGICKACLAPDNLREDVAITATLRRV